METAQLSIGDLVALHSIIDTACSRGAFKANEMKQVGEIYERLSNFLNSIQPPASDSTPAPEATQGDTNA